MAFSFSNGMIQGDNGYSFDLNPYLQRAKTSGDNTWQGGLGSFYDDWAMKQGGATKDAGNNVNYSGSYFGQGGANQASAIGASLAPQVQSWWESAYPKTQQNALVPAPTKVAAPPRQNALVNNNLNSNAAPQQTAGAAFQLPAGFDIRKGSTDPLDPVGQNKAVYGSNYFPGGLPGFENVTNAQQFAALTPDQQGAYREALYLWNQRQQGLGPQPGGVVPALPGTTGGTQEVGPYPGGGYQPPVTPPATQPPAATPTNPLAPPGPPGFGGGTDPANSGFPFPGAYTAPPFSYNEVEDFTKNPAYAARLKESERALNRQLLSMGRSDSTGGINAFATNARRLTGEFEQEAYNRAKGENVLNYDRALGENMTAYDRALTINKLTYDRKYQEDVLSYEREFRENERKYGRDVAEEILRYERGFREDARDYERVRWLVANGFVGGNTPTGA